MSPAPRRPHRRRHLAEELLDAYAALDPEAATLTGVAGHDHRLTDHSVDRHRRADARCSAHVLERLDGLEPVDATDVVTVDVLRERAARRDRPGRAGEHARALDVLGSPVQRMREVFDLMPTDDEADWAVVAERLRAVPGAVDGYASALRDSAAQGRVPPARARCWPPRRSATTTSARTGSSSPPPPGPAPARPAAPRGRPLTAAAEAPGGEDLLAELTTRGRPRGLSGLRGAGPGAAGGAARRGARGRRRREERYAPGCATTWAPTWTWRDLRVGRRRGGAAARRGRRRGPHPGGGQRRGGRGAARARPRPARPRRRGVPGLDADVSDEAVADLAGTHFDVPDAVRTLDCRIAPSSTGVVYYTRPRRTCPPGPMWWSVPKGMTSFCTWQQRTTVYHEGVPGHHLQIAQTVLLRDRLTATAAPASGCPATARAGRCTPSS